MTTKLAVDEVLAVSRVRQLLAGGEAEAIRTRAHVKRAELARALDVSPQTITRWETGEVTPRGEAALEYLALLDRLSEAQADIARPPAHP